MPGCRATPPAKDLSRGRYATCRTTLERSATFDLGGTATTNLAFSPMSLGRRSATVIGAQLAPKGVITITENGLALWHQDTTRTEI